MRLRRLLRLRRRDRRRAEAPLRRRAGAPCCLTRPAASTRSTAPEVARSLDGFVTKTITPRAARGNPPVRIAETDAGMLNSIGLANPGRERFLAETLPRLRELGVPLWVSVGGFSAAEYAETCAALDGRRGDRAQPLVPERRRGARERGGDRRGLPRRDEPAALREALARRLGHRRGGARRRGGRAPTASRSSTRSAGSRSTSARCGRSSAAAPAATPGPALKPVALAAVFACSAARRMPIVGMGGVQSGSTRSS